MPGAIQLSSTGQTRRPRTNDSDRFAGAFLGRIGNDPTFGETFVDDRTLDILNRHWRIAIDAHHAGAFAGRRTNATGKFGKVIGLVQTLQRFAPQPAINKVVPFGNQVVDRTAGSLIALADHIAQMAEGNSAVHTARALLLQPLFGQMLVELVPILNPLQRIAISRQFAFKFDKTGGFTHLNYLPLHSRTQVAAIASRKAVNSASSPLKPRSSTRLKALIILR